jgi:hypothetical protein
MRMAKALHRHGTDESKRWKQKNIAFTRYARWIGRLMKVKVRQPK